MHRRKLKLRRMPRLKHTLRHKPKCRPTRTLKLRRALRLRLRLKPRHTPFFRPRPTTIC